MRTDLTREQYSKALANLATGIERLTLRAISARSGRSDRPWPPTTTGAVAYVCGISDGSHVGSQMLARPRSEIGSHETAESHHFRPVRMLSGPPGRYVMMALGDRYTPIMPAGERRCYLVA